jgi:hypothetical protein
MITLPFVVHRWITLQMTQRDTVLEPTECRPSVETIITNPLHGVEYSPSLEA